LISSFAKFFKSCNPSDKLRSQSSKEALFSIKTEVRKGVELTRSILLKNVPVKDTEELSSRLSDTKAREFWCVSFGGDVRSVQIRDLSECLCEYLVVEHQYGPMPFFMELLSLVMIGKIDGDQSVTTADFAELFARYGPLMKLPLKMAAMCKIKPLQLQPWFRPFDGDDTFFVRKEIPLNWAVRYSKRTPFAVMCQSNKKDVKIELHHSTADGGGYHMKDGKTYYPTLPKLLAEQHREVDDFGSCSVDDWSDLIRSGVGYIEAKEEPKKDSTLCCICMSVTPDIVFITCGHLTLCDHCCEKLLVVAHNGETPARCPICRTEFDDDDLVHVYTS